MKLVISLCAALTGLLVTVVSMSPAESLANPPELVLTLKKNRLAGIWDYSVQDVPPEYKTGVLRIQKKGKEYQVSVELTEGTLQASEVIAKRNTINFYLMIDGQRVDVSLKVEGDTISGESTSADGVFRLEGTRRMA